jgi:hypothetical protein
VKPLQIGPVAIRLRIASLDIVAIGLMAFAIGIRMLLIAQGWPHTTIDEGTIGQMAMNIAYHGDHPVFFYGQEYMGALQAYLAAVLFHLFGVSLFTLRLTLILLYALFIISIYALTRLLYTKKFALFISFLLGLGTNLVIYRELQAIGGYPETLLFGSLALLLASWLALGNAKRRLLAYLGWGLVVGLGLWSDLLIIPCAIMSGLLLIVCCWRDLRSWAPLCLLVGLLIGALPLILFNLQAALGHDSLTTLLTIYHEGHMPLEQVLSKSVSGALLVSLPTITNYNPVCAISQTRFLAASGHGSLRCALGQGAWSLGAIVLWLSAVAMALVLLVSSKNRSWIRWQWRPQEFSQPLHSTSVSTELARLALLLSVAMSFVLFAISPTAAFDPSLNARYLICLLIGTPAILYPLWRGASRAWGKQSSVFLAVSAVQWAALLCIALLFCQGTIKTLQDIPDAHASDQQQYDLVRNLERVGIRHIYSDFWNCDRIIFMSSEQIACSVVNEQLQPTGDRSYINTTRVQSDSLASYVFLVDAPQAKTAAVRFIKSQKPYHSYMFDGYMVFQPL